jgi:hypothetical protein
MRPPSGQPDANDPATPSIKRRSRWPAILSALVLSVALVGCGAGADPASKPGPGPEHRAALGANLWVSMSGGRCVRRPRPSGEIAASACGSLEAAYQAAHCGDLVQIGPGDYIATQDIQDNPRLDNCSKPVVFTSSAKGRVYLASVEAGQFGDATTNGGSSWTLENVSLGDRITLLPPAHDVTLRGIHGGSFYVDGAQHVLIEGSTFGPCFSGVPQSGHCTNNSKIDASYQSGGRTYTTSDVVVRHNVLHHYVNDADSHFECLFLAGGDGITIDANVFADCENYGIFMQPYTEVGFAGLVIENNVFYSTQASNGSARIYALDFGGNGSPIDNVLIRFNSFAPNEGITDDGAPPGSGDVVLGNIVGYSGTKPCIAGVTYAYDIELDARCGPTNVAVRRLPYADRSAGAAAFSLTPSSVARGLVPAGNASADVPTDFFGTPRPAGKRRDAGAIQSPGLT